MVTESTPNWEKTAFILNGLVTKTLDIAIDGSMMLILPSIYGVPGGVNAILLSGIGVPIDHGIAMAIIDHFMSLWA